MKSEWALVKSLKDKVYVEMYLGCSKQWCLKHCDDWGGERIYQNLEVKRMDENLLEFTGVFRPFLQFSIKHKYYDFSLLENFEIEEDQYEVGTTIWKRKKYFKVDSGLYLRRTPGKIIDSITTRKFTITSMR